MIKQFERLPLQVFAIFFSAFATFFLSIFFTEFVYDDRIHILNNTLLQLPDGIFSLSTEPVFPGNLFRPITFISFWIESILFGKSAWHFHFFNCLLHAINCSLLFLIFFYSRFRSIAFFSVALFALHPVHTEVVVGIVGRAELLSLTFGLLALIAAQYTRILLTLFFLFLAVLSKESGVIFAPLLLLFFWGYEKDNIEILKKLIPLSFILLLMVLVVRVVVFGDIALSYPIDFVDNPIAALPTSERVINALSLLFHYFTLCLFPYPLQPDYSFAVLKPLSFESALPGVVATLCLFITGASLYLKNSSSLFGFGLLWFFISFAVTSNVFFPIGTIFGDRLLYIPSFGVCLILGLLLSQIPLIALQKGVWLLCCIFLLFWSLTYQRAWSSQEALFDWQAQYSVIEKGESVKSLVNSAILLRNKEEYQGAEALLERAITIYPNSVDAYYALSTLYAVTNNQEKARDTLRQTLLLNPRHLPALLDSARRDINTRKFSTAESKLLLAIEIEPRSINVLKALYALRLFQNDIKKAAPLFSKLKKYGASDEEFNRLADFHKVIVRELKKQLKEREVSKNSENVSEQSH